MPQLHAKESSKICPFQTEAEVLDDGAAYGMISVTSIRVCRSEKPLSLSREGEEPAPAQHKLCSMAADRLELPFLFFRTEFSGKRSCSYSKKSRTETRDTKREDQLQTTRWDCLSRR